MSTEPRVVTTEAGPLTLSHVSRETLEALALVFPRIGYMEREQGDLLALATGHEERGMLGLRTGYGWYEPKHAEIAQKMALIGRLRLLYALAAFRARGFTGVFVPATCVWRGGADDDAGAHLQQGELLFIHAREPLANAVEGKPLPTYEKLFGEGSSGALLSFVADSFESWKTAGLTNRVLTDLEPCPASDERVRWWADVVLVDGRVLLVRPELRDDDVILAELARAGFTEIEWAPSSFVLFAPRTPASTSAPEAPDSQGS
ncbi:MAG: hypothetical protein KAY61_03890 [Candidatus Eisenbacteria bacterium]|nr:hypothetical protein [Candidatus Eisenbacteria bacterium]